MDQTRLSTPIRLSLILAAAVAACAGSRTEQRPAPASSQVAQPAPARSHDMARGMAAACPMDVPGAKISTEDTAQGEALTFTTSDPGQVSALRERVHALADMHNRHMAGEAAGAGTGSGDSQPVPGHHRGMMPASRATAQDVDGGARVEIVPDDPGQADQVRAMARMHAQHMQTQGCGMMHGG